MIPYALISKLNKQNMTDNTKKKQFTKDFTMHLQYNK